MLWSTQFSAKSHSSYETGLFIFDRTVFCLSSTRLRLSHSFRTMQRETHWNALLNELHIFSNDNGSFVEMVCVYVYLWMVVVSRCIRPTIIALVSYTKTHKFKLHYIVIYNLVYFSTATAKALLCITNAPILFPWKIVQIFYNKLSFKAKEKTIEKLSNDVGIVERLLHTNSWNRLPSVCRMINVRPCANEGWMLRRTWHTQRHTHIHTVVSFSLVSIVVYVMQLWFGAKAKERLMKCMGIHCMLDTSIEIMCDEDVYLSLDFSVSRIIHHTYTSIRIAWQNDSSLLWWCAPSRLYCPMDADMHLVQIKINLFNAMVDRAWHRKWRNKACLYSNLNANFVRIMEKCCVQTNGLSKSHTEQLVE